MGRRMTNKKMNRSKKQKSRRSKVRRTKNKTRKQYQMRGGNSALFPASFSNSDVAVSPQSYLPYNKFENDPGYSTIASRNTGPFLTGVSSGGRKMRRRYNGGAGNDLTSSMSNAVNFATNSTGIIPAPALNELSGVAGVMSGFSNTGSSYSSTPLKMVPLA
jgi:hypothetical protein